MRVELNISVSDKPDVFGTKVEVKNINSFRAVERAAVYETKRMIDLLESGRGNEIVQETRGWDETKQATFSQRSKENAQDYRYFPDPDIPKYYLRTLFDIPALQAGLPELPAMKRIRYQEQFGIKADDVENYVTDPDLGMYFEDVVTELAGNKEAIQTASNYIISDLVGLKKKDTNFEFPYAHHLAELVLMISGGELSSRAAKDLLPILRSENRSPRVIADERGLIQKDDPEALRALAEKVISENSEAVASYKSGKQNALMSLVGVIMKESKGSANPAKAKEMLEKILS